MADQNTATTLAAEGHERGIRALEAILRPGLTVAELEDTLREAGMCLQRVEVPGEQGSARGFPPELAALSACADELASAHDPGEKLWIVIRMQNELLGPAARAARAAGLGQHSKVIARLQIAVASVEPEDMSEEEIEAIVYAARLLGSERITRDESRRVGRLMRKAELDVTQLRARREREAAVSE